MNINELNIINQYLNGSVHVDIKPNTKGFTEVKIEYNTGKKIALLMFLSMFQNHLM